MSNDLLPRSISGDILVGTNSKWHHIQQAYQLGIIDPDDIVLGFFDGVVFDEAGKRVGGLALSDFMLITNTRVTLWMRDQIKDYVDHFPLSHVFVAEKSQKDLLHGTLRLTLLLPDVDLINKTKEPSKVILSFDFIPLPDLSLIADMLDVLGSAMRDMVEGGAGLTDRVQAILILFQKVFVSKFQQLDSAQNAGLRTTNGFANTSASNTTQFGNFAADGATGDGFNAGMTPLRRLDGFDAPDSQMGNQPPAPPKSTNGYGYSNPNEARLFQTGETPAYSPYNQESPYAKNPNPPNEMNWANGQQSASPRFGGGGRQRRGAGDAGQGDYQSQTPQGDIPPESIYMMGRVARTAWDGLSKMRQEAESRAAPALQSLRNSGFNLKEMTEFLTAANGLMETVSKNPAARELAMAFINKSTGGLQFGNSNKSSEEQRTSKNENDDANKAPSLRSVPVAGKALKVERRTSGKPSNITSVHLSDKELKPISVETPETSTSEIANLSVEQLPDSVKVSANATDESNPETKKVKRLPIRRKGISTAEDFMPETNAECNTSVGVKTDLSIFMTNNTQYDKQENQTTLAVSDGPALN
ncbi:hypothetical protein [Candidatus Chlorohelix sp.]|uniref:hypothetical protein n=1 Tax=Candidatus Chlorohelix sp. TaxID=3139201 RepID=UPI00302154F8